MTAASEFTIGEVAAMTGLSTHTVRAWERRHGALSPARNAARQRRYTRAEVEFLLRVKHLTRVAGRSLKVAIQEARGNAPMEQNGSGPAPALPAPRSSSIWRSVADYLPLLIAILDGRGVIVDANISLIRAIGRTRREVHGMRFVDLIDPHDRAKAARIYRRPLQPHRDWELNVRLPSLTGLYAFDCRPIREGDQWLIACLGRDLSQAGVVV